ncbi:hypothetical protein [Kitasatospora sp. NPDC050543]|uniref:hypothetical protein n=1 Tax=Kitasatospora sp. NPDC050543 TaxID=3364054 RepID=UPI00379E1A0B
MSQAEDEYWAAKLTEARHGQLDTVRKAATNWSTLFTAVLGVFSAVTFASGLPGLDELDRLSRLIVQCAIGVAAVAALAATLLAGRAANSIPKVASDLSISALQETTKKTAGSALNLLNWSLRCGVVAAVVVVAGSFFMLLAEKSAKPESVTKVISVVDGKAYCGAPKAGADGNLTVGGVALSRAASITVVPACPGTP